MRFVVAIMAILVSATGWAADFSVGISPAGLVLYSITNSGPTLVGSPFPTPTFDSVPVTPVAAVMNERHDFVFVLYEHLNSSDGRGYILGLKITKTGLHQRWVFSQVLDMNPEANPLVKLTTGPNYATVTWTNDFSSPYTGWIINEFGQLIAENISQIGGNEQISLHVAPHENAYYYCHVEGFPGPQTPMVSAYGLDNDAFANVPNRPFPQNTLLFESADPVFVASICN
jgi:hypothetical protein